MRKLTVKSDNVEVSVSDWTTYINNARIEDIIKDNIEEGTFRAKVTILIEEIENPLLIQGTKKMEETEEE